MNLKVFVAALLAVLSGTTLQAQAPADTPAFGESVEVNVVNVDVYVSDKSGRRITDLKQGDFELLEDGKPVPITNFEMVAGRAVPQEAAAPQAPAPEAPMAAVPEDALNLVVLFDNSNIKPANRTRAAQQLREFLTHNLSPGDRVMLVTQGLGLKVQLPFSGDPAAIARAMDEIQRTATQGLQSDQDRRFAFQAIMSIQQASVVSPDPLPCPLNIATPAHTYAASRRDEVRRALGSLTVLVNSLSGVPGRKALLHVSDGLPLIPGEEVFEMLVALCGGGGTSGLGSFQGPTGVEISNNNRVSEGGDGATLPRDTRDFDPLTVYDARMLGPRAYQAATQAPIDAQSYNVTKDLRKLAAHANAHRVTLYTLQASGLAAPDGSDLGTAPSDALFRFPAIAAALRNNNRDSLQFLADETGGRSILDTNDFRPDLARMREDFESYYSLGFTPAHTGDGREHKIEVKIKRQGTRLRYRQSYRDKPAVEKLVDRTLASLYHGFDDNPLNVAMEIGDQIPGAAGTWTVPVKLRIPLFKLAVLNRDETYEGALKLFVVTGTPDGANSPVRQVNVPLKIPRKEVLSAMGQFYVYNLTLTMKPGEHKVALAVRDEVAATTSYLSRPVTVGEAVAAGTEVKP